jgi:hypothetical protein
VTFGSGTSGFLSCKGNGTTPRKGDFHIINFCPRFHIALTWILEEKCPHGKEIDWDMFGHDHTWDGVEIIRVMEMRNRNRLTKTPIERERNQYLIEIVERCMLSIVLILDGISAIVLNSSTNWAPFFLTRWIPESTSSITMAGRMTHWLQQQYQLAAEDFFPPAHTIYYI